MFTHVGAVARLERLIVAVHTLHHPRDQQSIAVRVQQRVPALSPHHLDDVPSGAAEVRLKLLDDLPVPADGSVQALQVAVDHEDQVVEVLTTRERDRTHGFRLVHLAVAHEGPDFPVRGVGQATSLEVGHEPGLVDRHQGAKAHRDGRELPELGHQPRVGIRREPLPADLLAEVAQLILAQPSFEEGAGVNPR